MDPGRSKEEQKEDAARVKDTNVEGIGSQENRDLRKAAAETEKAWVGAGKEPGIQIWRIEKFKVVAWPKEQYGHFYGGDSYIVLNTKKDPDSDALSYDVHFWLGSETSQDEAGVAAYKTVELDDLLGDEPVQYREVQGNESRMFTDLFPRITVMNGGVDSGFNTVEPQEYRARLMHLEGYKQNVQSSEVKMDVGSLNSRDTFVLDNGLSIYQFNGSKSSAWEKRKANDLVNSLRDERTGKVEKHVVIDGLTDVQDEAAEFWKLLGGKPDALTEEAEEEKKSAEPRKQCIVRIKDEDGKVTCEEVCGGEIKMDVLKSEDAFVVDTGTSLYIWIGKGASKSEKREAMPHALAYMKERGLDPRECPICRISEGREPDHFKMIMGADGWNADMIKKGGFAGRRSAAVVYRDMRPEK